MLQALACERDFPGAILSGRLIFLPWIDLSGGNFLEDTIPCNIPCSEYKQDKFFILSVSRLA